REGAADIALAFAAGQLLAANTREPETAMEKSRTCPPMTCARGRERRQASAPKCPATRRTSSIQVLTGDIRAALFREIRDGRCRARDRSDSRTPSMAAAIFFGKFVARVLRILVSFAAFCRWKLLKLFKIIRRWATHNP